MYGAHLASYSGFLFTILLPEALYMFEFTKNIHSYTFISDIQL